MAQSVAALKFFAVAFLLAFATVHLPARLAHAASAETTAAYPNKPVRLLMGPAAGGPTDGLGRILAARLNELWGQPVIVENRPGAGNTIATTIAARAIPDGYTLLLCPLSDAIAPAVYKLEYDFLRDIRAVARIGTTANVFVVNPSVPVRSVKEFIAHARQHPGKLDYGAQGISQAGYLSMELLKSMADKIDVRYVAYKAASVLTGDLLAGRIHAQITNLPSHLPNISTGKVRALGVTTPKRDRRLPEVPAIAETLPGFDVTTWYGICAPSGMPAALASKVSADVTQALNTGDVRRRLEGYGVDPDPSTPDVFAALLRAETAKWAKVVKEIHRDDAAGKTVK
jgi:tripartite-type tricarboxylate transporter receptor subunit TctC